MARSISEGLRSVFVIQRRINGEKATRNARGRRDIIIIIIIIIVVVVKRFGSLWILTWIVCMYVYTHIYKSIDQPTNQPITQPTNQSINQSTNQSTNQPINQPINQLTNQAGRYQFQKSPILSNALAPHCYLVLSNSEAIHTSGGHRGSNEACR